MGKKLFIDGNVGGMYIGNDTLPNEAVLDPAPYIKDLNFHTSMNYLQIKATLSASNVSFASLAREYRTWNDSGKC